MHTEGKLTAKNGAVYDESGWALLPSEASARRLVACWNALEGVPTEWLESFGAGVIRQIEETVALTQERTELVYVLREMRGAWSKARSFAAMDVMFAQADSILARYPEVEGVTHD